MRQVEQVKIIAETTEAKLEEAYNAWYIALSDARESAPITRGQPLVILDRRMTVKVSGKNRVLFLAIFYEHTLMLQTEVGKDRGKHLDQTGVSVVGPRGRRA
jgi:hypothetical protein